MNKKSILSTDTEFYPISDIKRDRMLKEAEEAYGKFMDVVKPKWRDSTGSVGTPRRVAKMFINELQAGVFGEAPRMTDFANEKNYDGIVFQGNIEVKSMCEHHHMPFFGVAHIAYIPKEGSGSKIIGLSKLNRLVEFFSRRMQTQEHLTQLIHDTVDEIIGDNQGVAVSIEAKHTCVSHRGIRQNSTMKTSKLSGRFWDNEIGTRSEFYRFISNLKQ